MTAWLWLSDIADLLQPLSARLAITLLHCLWQGVAVAAALAIGLRWLRDANSRYVAACVAIFTLPVLALATFISIETKERTVRLSVSPQPGIAASPLVLVDAAEPPDTGPGKGPEIRDAVASPAEAAMTPANEMETPRDASTLASFMAGALVKPMVRLSPLVSLAYVLGVGWMLLRTMVSVWLGYRVRRSAAPCQDLEILGNCARLAKLLGLNAAPAVAVCQRITAPAVVGLVKPIILLPPTLLTSLTADELSALLAHELAHIRRHDMWIHILQRVVESLLFFHPATWWISRQVNVEREHCCDDFAAATGASPVEYAAALLRMAELCAPHRGGRFATQLATLSATGHKPTLLARRVERLLGVARSPQVNAARLGAAGLLLMVVGVASSVCVIAQNPESGAPMTEPSVDPPGSGEDPSQPADAPQAETAKGNPSVANDSLSGFSGAKRTKAFAWHSSCADGEAGLANSTRRRDAVSGLDSQRLEENDPHTRSPLEYPGLVREKDRINLIGSKSIMSFAVAPQAFRDATLTIPPGDAKNLVLQQNVGAVIRPKDEPKRAGMSPLGLEPGKYHVYASQQIFYHTEKDPNPERYQSKQVTLRTPDAEVEVLPAARLRFHRLFRLSQSELETVLSKSNYAVHKWSPAVGATEQWVMDHSQACDVG